MEHIDSRKNIQKLKHESLPGSVPSKGDRFSRGNQASYQEVERFFQDFDQIAAHLKPHILWLIMVVVAIYYFFHTSDVGGFLIIIAAAAGYISLSQAIEFLRGQSIPVGLLPSSEQQEADSQPGEIADDEQDEST